MNTLAVMLNFFAPFALAAEPTPSIQAEVERLLHHPDAVMNIFELQARGLQTGRTPEQPWMSSYWPDAIGGIATRYNDRYFLPTPIRNVINFSANKKEWADDNRRMKERAFSLSEEEIAVQLSPAEKYDLLMGDRNFTFTNNVIAEIDYRFRYKKNWDTGLWKEEEGFSPWVGICDGWTTAALHLPRPEKTVRVMGGTGQVVTFYPNDLKALASHLFARTNDWLGVARVGNRCAQKRVKRNEFGTPYEKGCADIDPGLWHATVLNRIGIDKTGFIIDVDNKSSVNNHPVFAYQVKYFNPLTGIEGTLEHSVLPVQNLRERKEIERHPKTAYVVGAQMEITLLNYAFPDKQEETDSEENDKLITKKYSYDVEIAANGDIIGGKWHAKGRKTLFANTLSEVQPDMIWMLAPGQLAWSLDTQKAFDGLYKDPTSNELWGNMNWSFHGDGIIPTDWYSVYQTAAVFKAPGSQPWATIRSPHPLAEMVYYLFDQAKK